jgi:hypothetical protein
MAMTPARQVGKTKSGSITPKTGYTFDNVTVETDGFITKVQGHCNFSTASTTTNDTRTVGTVSGVDAPKASIISPTINGAAMHAVWVASDNEIKFRNMKGTSDGGLAVNDFIFSLVY